MSEVADETRTEIEQQMDEAIKLTLLSMGVEVNDPASILAIKNALKKKLEEIISNVTYASHDESLKVLKMTDLKSALKQLSIKIDRPDYILEQQQSSAKPMGTRTRKTK